MRILLLEDEEAIRGFVRINLKRNGMDVTEAEDGETALMLANEADPPFDVALLDVMLPTISGFEVCEQLREKFPRMGIIMLTAKSQEEDKIRGLELGADDYVQKPFSPGELIARLGALHRRMMPGGLSWPEAAGDAEGVEAGSAEAAEAGESAMQRESGDGSGPSASDRDASVDGCGYEVNSREGLEATGHQAEEWNRADDISQTAGRSGESSAVNHSANGEKSSGGAIPVGSDSVDVKTAAESESEAAASGGTGESNGFAGPLAGSAYAGTTPAWNGSAAGEGTASASMEDRPRVMPSHADMRRQNNELHEGVFRLSSTERRLWKRNEEVVLTPTEWTLVKLLMERAGEGLSRDDILDAVWGRHFIGDLKIVDVNIRRIRQKIEDEPSDPRFIETLWGYGYRWKRSDGQ